MRTHTCRSRIFPEKLAEHTPVITKFVLDLDSLLHEPVDEPEKRASKFKWMLTGRQRVFLHSAFTFLVL